jgi:hypothetical protein
MVLGPYCEDYLWHVCVVFMIIIFLVLATQTIVHDHTVPWSFGAQIASYKRKYDLTETRPKIYC